MPPVGGIPLDCLDPTLDIPSKSSRRASIFDHSLGIPDSGARDRLSNPFGGSACDLSRLSRVRSLAYKGRKRPWRFAFLPVGRAFLGGSRYCVGVEFGASYLGGGKKDRQAAHLWGGVTSFIGSVRWWTAAYKYPVASPAFFLPLSALLPLLSCLRSLAA